MQPKNHASQIKGIPKAKLQGSWDLNPKTMQLKTRRDAKKRLAINGLAVVHGRPSRRALSGGQHYRATRGIGLCGTSAVDRAAKCYPRVGAMRTTINRHFSAGAD